MTPRALVALPLATACAHVQVTDPALTGPATALGDASTVLVRSPSDASPDLLARRVDAVEAALVDLGLAHDAWTPADARVVPAQHPLRFGDPAAPPSLIGDGAPSSAQWTTGGHARCWTCASTRSG